MRATPPVALSVALCTFNGERFVGAQLESILTQSLPVNELVVSDDASTDRTLDVVEDTVRRIGSGVSLLILRNQVPLGVTANFEQALSACSGDLVALSDQDDIWHPGRLAEILPLFEDGSVLLAHTDADLVGADGESLGATLFDALEIPPETIEEVNSGDALGVFLRRNIVTGATVVLRRALVDAIRPFPSGWVHDEWLAICATLLGSVRCLPRPTIDYRQHGGNQIGAQRPTLRYKVGRVFEPGAERQCRLALQFAQLAERAPVFAELHADDLQRVRRKAEFEEQRAQLPRRRFSRLGAVRRLAVGGGYARFASQGHRDIIRDLLREE